MALRLFHFAVGYYFSRAYQNALEAANHAIQTFPEWPQSHRFRAAAQLGRTEEAKAALEKAIAIALAAFDLYVRMTP